VGNWNYGGCYNIFRYIAAHIVFVAGLLGIFVLALPLTTDSFYGKYILSFVGFTLMGASLSSFIPLLLIKERIITIVDPESKT
jgi:hypothetical protein